VNKAIRRVWVVVAIMVLALMINITASYLLRSESLLNNPQNRRVLQAQFNQQRGAILVGNTPVVQTVAVQGPYAYQREYSNGPLYAPVSGYFSFSYGRSKLEQVYNSQLSGSDSDSIIQRVQDEITGQLPQGASIQTTINAKAQQAAWNAIGDHTGAVVAVDYTTGAILAYVSRPSYDPGPLAGSDAAAVQAAWNAMNSDPSKPGLDRAGGEIKPPGSTFKLIVLSAALEAGYTLDSMIDSPNKLLLPGTNTYLGNADSCGGTQITLRQALRVSCNTAFANLGMKLGQDAIRAQAEKYGFDAKFGGDVNSVASTFPTNLSEDQLAMSSIGQFDVAATPLQMAMVSAAIANGGVEMQPHFVSEIRNPDLSLLSTTKTKQLSTPVDPATASALQDAMFGVVDSGTGTAAQVSGMKIGGKTGTAENDPSHPSFSWFTGFSTDPHVAIAVFSDGGPKGTVIFQQGMEAFK
jgi:peptidoglycan glycosyltransferase